MKAIFIFLLMLLFWEAGYCQLDNNMTLAEDKATVQRIDGYLKSKEFISAIKELNSFIPRYTTIGSLYFTRGLAYLGLNDFEKAKKDFLLAKSSGYTANDIFINARLSNKYIAEKLLKEMKLDPLTDSLRNFKPVITPKDTLQGGMRTERSCFDVYFYDLTVKILPETKSIAGSNLIYFKTVSATKKIQIDLFQEFKINSIKINNKDLNFTRLYNAVFIDLDKVYQPGENVKLLISYAGVPRSAPKPPWNGGFVWEKEKGRNWIGVACEQLGASSWWPVKDHLSDKPDSMRINLQVPAGYIGISNGNLRGQSSMEGFYTNFEWFVSYPINSYNVTIYVGDFINFNEIFTNQNGPYNIDYYVLPRNLEKAKKYYAQTKEILSIYEKLFGEYPFRRDGVGMVEAPFEGMEHQGAIAIGGEYGKGSKRETWPKGYDYLLIHETAHEWWGNALAVGDMADAWINEGFTTYAECLFAEEKSGYPDYISTIASKQYSIFNLWPVVGTKNINENTFLTGDIYNKGASMLNNLRCILDNDSLFHRIIHDYYQKYKYKITTTTDFTNLVKEYTRMDLDDFFNKFLYDADPPVLQCIYNIDLKGNLTFTYRWLNAGPKFTMPFCIAVNNKQYIKLTATNLSQTFKMEKVKQFCLINENNFDPKLVPHNAFTYFATSWPFL